MTRRLLPWLALVALLMQAAIPAGLMPDFAAKGPGLRLTICDGTMPAMDRPATGQPMAGMTMPAQKHGHSKTTACPYAMAVTLWFMMALLSALFWLKPTADLPDFFYSLTQQCRPFGSAAPRAPPTF